MWLVRLLLALEVGILPTRYIALAQELVPQHARSKMKYYAEVRHKSAKMFPRFSADIAKVLPDGPSLQIGVDCSLPPCYFYMRYFKNKHSQNGDF